MTYFMFETGLVLDVQKVIYMFFFFNWGDIYVRRADSDDYLGQLGGMEQYF